MLTREDGWSQNLVIRLCYGVSYTQRDRDSLVWSFNGLFFNVWGGGVGKGSSRMVPSIQTKYRDKSQGPKFVTRNPLFLKTKATV